MLKVTHEPTKTDDNHYTIEGNNISELIDECVRRIRTKSRDFYRRELNTDLETTGKSLIDRHAGQGNFYTVKLTKKAN